MDKQVEDSAGEHSSFEQVGAGKRPDLPGLLMQNGAP